MSKSPNAQTKSSKRRYILLLSAIVLVIAGWSAAWFYGRSVLAEELDGQMRTLAQNGLDISCADLTIAGYPFRYEVSCRNMRSLDRAGTSGSLQSLNAVALIYNPRHIIFEAEAPAVVDAPLSGAAGEVSWETARASVKFSQEALGDVDLVFQKPEAALEDTVSAGVFAAEKAEIHLRSAPDQADALDGFLSVDGLQLQSIPQLQDSVDFRGHVQISGGTALLAGLDLVSLVRINGGELPVKLVLLEASLGDGSLGANGDLMVGGDGTLSGSINVTLANADDLLRALKPLFPPNDSSFSVVEGVINSLKSAGEGSGDSSTVSVPVVLDRGLIKIGFLTLGQIPPLFSAGI
ncbi:MAG: DUF2125 domain-containing protein [Roseibium sp.]|uniref:DUF2125 domain-containing protein n=1 Tax=Roseibium sp. TaxID=1936156 RepID=UPI0026065C05|nr:DUF2125 domain-containing protein [Roseibium sp.]MCV0429725.1 DUF2125 domain-containing protein [Roseibium sp.]